jgi:hypothetical protein
MPRKGKGGARTSPPGTIHSNRTDMVQPARAKTGQTYGVAGAQIAAQQAMPLPAAPPTPTPGGPPSAAGGGANPLAVLAGLPGLTDPTQRPNEPLTSGLPIGAGPNGPGAPASPGTSLIRKMIAAGNGDPVLFQLLAEAERAEPPNSYAAIPPAPPGPTG